MIKATLDEVDVFRDFVEARTKRMTYIVPAFSQAKGLPVVADNTNREGIPLSPEMAMFIVSLGFEREDEGFVVTLLFPEKLGNGSSERDDVCLSPWSS
jgi:hypothetical protein